MAVVEAGIAKRGKARHLLGSAHASWQARCVRRLLDGVNRAEEIRSELGALDFGAKELKSQVDTVEGDLSGLTDDEEFNRQFREAEGRWKELSGRDQRLDTDHQVAARTLETLATKYRELSDKARAADGRNVETAQGEEAAARAALEGDSRPRAPPTPLVPAQHHRPATDRQIPHRPPILRPSQGPTLRTTDPDQPLSRSAAPTHHRPRRHSAAEPE